MVWSHAGDVSQADQGMLRMIRWRNNWNGPVERVRNPFQQLISDREFDVEVKKGHVAHTLAESYKGNPDTILIEKAPCSTSFA